MKLPQLEKEDAMRKAPEIALMGMLLMTFPLAQACSSLFGSGAGEEETAYDERIDEPKMKFIPPQDLSVTTSRPSPSMRAELSARNATGLPRGSLMDVLFDFDRATLRASGARHRPFGAASRCPPRPGAAPKGRCLAPDARRSWRRNRNRRL